MVLLEHSDNSAAKRLRSRKPSPNTSCQGPKRNSRDDTNIRPSDFPIKRFTILDSCRLQPSKAKFQSDSADVADQTGEASLDSLDTLEAGELAPATPGTFSSANKRRKGAARGLFPPLSGSIGCRVGPKFGHSQVVVIGLRLEREAIEAALDACLMTDDEIDSAAVGSTRAPLFACFLHGETYWNCRPYSGTRAGCNVARHGRPKKGTCGGTRDGTARSPTSRHNQR